MKSVKVFLLGGLLGAASVFAQQAVAQENLPKVCAQAQIFVEASRFDLAEAYADQCYSQPGASQEVLILGHYTRAVAFARLSKPKEALEQLEILMKPPLSQSQIYDRRSSGLKFLGATQALIHAEASRFSLVLGDTDKGVNYAQTAITLASLEPATHIDVLATAYMLRARVRASRQDSKGAMADLARAYIRGSQDPFVLENVKAFPAADLERLDALKTRMLDAYSKYFSLYITTGGFVSSVTYLASLKAEADPLYQAVLADEAAYVGQDT